MLARHATRTPSRTFSTKKLPKLIELKSKITKSPTLSERDFQAIKNWATTIDITGHRSLTPKGRDEMKGLAIRVREAFPNLFERQYDPDVYKVLSTKSERCVISGKVFMENVLNDEAIPELPICDNTDILLTLEGMMKDDEEYDDVQAYIKDQEKEFKGGPHMAGVVQRVAAKLGIDSEELNPEIITTMYEASAYEYSNDESVVPAWYNVFCPDDLEVSKYSRQVIVMNRKHLLILIRL
ncbi:multiple inositol polyphosphate phosphatase 1-like [Adelges cooleyi]|uniref:multiple inositol polyphosphate phosphatase 1-like n=1 Tax=Adelges cooleyi TaxID=133065 RepID=UPI00217F4121|nr:multiple inositol polyphosphate phosphatase 1-like [Adelges cooleyi]